MNTMRRITTIAAIALTLSIGSTSAANTITYHGMAWPPIGTPAYSGSCTITEAWEDGSARAVCADGAIFIHDMDGGYIYDHGIRFYHQKPGTWVRVR